VRASSSSRDRRPGRPKPDDERRRRFEALTDAYYAELLGYAARRVPQPADAADIACDVFLVAWRRIDEVPDGPEAKLWLYGVARLTVANFVRGVRRRSELHARLSSQIDALQVDIQRPSFVEPVVEALNKLSDDDRELLTLTAWEGLTPAQISAILGIEAATIRVRLHRARSRLKILLGDDMLLKRAGASGHIVVGRASARPSPGKAP
jgi:RNA polymerase sigma-70 factor (ECF subfamily)